MINVRFDFYRNKKSEECVANEMISDLKLPFYYKHQIKVFVKAKQSKVKQSKANNALCWFSCSRSVSIK